MMTPLQQVRVTGHSCHLQQSSFLVRFFILVGPQGPRTLNDSFGEERRHYPDPVTNSECVSYAMNAPHATERNHVCVMHDELMHSKILHTKG